jgi:predicted phage terminase large subunit-like protein
MYNYLFPPETERPPYLAYLKTVTPPSWTLDKPHLRLIAKHIDAVERGEIDRLAIFMPPRHAKTETLTVRYPAYCFLSDPTQNCLITGYNERFAARLGRKARGVAVLGGCQLDREKVSASEWQTKSGGACVSRGVGSPPTGIGFHRIVIDDPVKSREDAESEAYREKCWDWYTDDVYTRLEPGGAIVIVMTQWHEDDLSVRAIASEPGRWTVLRLPALSEGEGDLLGRPEGEALWRERYDEESLGRIRDVMAQNEGLRSWEALYQCNPTPREGSFFQVNKIRITETVPGDLDEVRAWDLASTAGGGDFTAGVKIGRSKRGDWYVLDVIHGQWEPTSVQDHILQAAWADGRHCQVFLPQDPGQAGKAQVEQMARLLAGFRVSSERVTGSKEVRAWGWAAQINAGNVFLVKAKWNAAFLAEYRSFPGGKRDDIVDAGSDGFNKLALYNRIFYAKKLL